MVITDPKVIEYIESFEALKALNPLPDIELSGERPSISVHTDRNVQRR